MEAHHRVSGPTTGRNSGGRRIIKNCFLFLGAGEPNIIPESVHYVGYFSNHEQSMQTVMQMQMTSTETALASAFSRATSHCRRDHLWNRLHTNSSTNALAFPELVELLTLTRIEEMDLSDLSIRGSDWFVKLVSISLSPFY